MKLAAIVVTYYPDEQLVRNISSYLDDVDWLLIWENTPAQDSVLTDAWVKHRFGEKSAKISRLGTGENVGLAIAYNEGVKYARSHGYTHLMTMDQDSRFEEFAGYKRRISEETDQSVGIMSPLRNQPTVYYGWKPYGLKWEMQSGSVFSLSMMEKIGEFRTDFFTDCIDVEIGLRAHRFGYRLMVYSDCNMIHYLGGTRRFKVLFFNVSLGDYSPLRRFYQIRNELFLWKEYPGDFSLNHKLFFWKVIVKSVFKIILAEQNKTAKLKAIFRGIFQGLFSIKTPF